MVHEPCLYLGTVDGKCIIFKRQVDDFAIATPNMRTSNILLDMLDAGRLPVYPHQMPRLLGYVQWHQCHTDL
jgi:hypothetical protein